jgi:hypothetical protein
MNAGGVEWIGLPADTQGFVRRECPRCRRAFKTKGGPADGAIVQRHLGRHVPFQNPHEVARDDAAFHCVYCGRLAGADAWCTPQQRAWLATVGSALDKEIRFEQLAFAYRTLRDNPSPSFVPVAPPRPLPAMRCEPDDMRRVAFFCCAEDVKVEAHWRQSVFCPRCGAQHHTAGPKPLRLRLLPEPVDA